MVLNNLDKLIDYVKLNHPKDSIDISDSLDLLNLALDGLRVNINDSLTQSLNDKNYDITREVTDISEMVFELQSAIDGYATALIVGLDSDEELVENENINVMDKTNPDYAHYTVNNAIPHSLYEDFTHKKAEGFSFRGMRYEAKDWKDVLLQTCGILAEIDINLFYSLIDDPVMKGRINSYLGYERIETETGVKNTRMENLNIYVWTNLSANSIRNLIRKLLKKYGIRYSDFNIFLRADYTPLHQNEELESTEIKIDNGEKIGKFVRLTMREISNRRHSFSQNALIAMQSKDWAKNTLDLNHPLLKPYVEGINISEQMREGSYNRYWKEIFEFNNEKFLITSQWYDKSREKFSNWIANI